MLNLHLNKYRELRWVTCRITSLTSANEQWRGLTVARTCNVFVVFGFRRHASITASEESTAVAFSAAPPAGAHKPPPVS